MGVPEGRFVPEVPQGIPQGLKARLVLRTNDTAEALLFQNT